MFKKAERTKDGMDSMIDQTHDAVVDVADRAQNGVETAAQYVVERARAAGDSLRDGAGTVSRTAHRGLQGTAQKIDRGYGRARSSLSRAATASTDYVAENPGKAALFTAAAGFVLGVLVGRRRRSD
ncbi:MAG TPA: hypothetical protein VLB51_04545 [Methylomirabilota bacterium]|nr:hypothetical protein [Methylomirabilota bacterium]